MANLSAHEKAMLRRKKRRLGIKYITFLFLFLVGMFALIDPLMSAQLKYKRELNQYHKLLDMQVKVGNELNSVSENLLYYSNSALSIATLESPNKMTKYYLASLMLNISALQKKYAQITLFDKKGDEVISIVQKVDHSSQQRSSAELENKSGYIYFQEALRLRSGQIYVSHFFINQSHGQVANSIKPILHFSTPIYSNKNELLGVGGIDYSGEKILRIFTELDKPEGERIFLINGDGSYIKGDQSEENRELIFSENKPRQFASDYSDVWKKMMVNDKGVVMTDKGEFYFSAFHLRTRFSPNHIDGPRFYCVISIPKMRINHAQWILFKELLIGFLTVFIVLALMGWKLAQSRIDHAWLLNKLKFEARHDALTGLYNRKAIIDFLKKFIAASWRRNIPLSVGFIDVNDLKKMNDQYGHDAGDDLIKGVADVIKASIRESDFAARLGGDEFLIVFSDCDKEGAHLILERIQAKYRQLGRIKMGKTWSISFGCSELLASKDCAEKMIERADNAMYKHKKSSKSKLKS